MTIPKVKLGDSSAHRAMPAGWRDDHSLIEGCLGSDQTAWRQLIERYSRLVFSIPKRSGLDEQSCDDVFQTVFIALLDQLSKLRDYRTLPKWLITATHRATWRALKDRNPRQSNGMLQDAGDRDPPALPADQLIAWERQHLVRQAMERLGGRCQTLLEALYLDSTEPSYEIVSRRLQIPIGSIGPTRARCLAKLSEICGEMGFE